MIIWDTLYYIFWSETTLIGESRFHRSTPWGLNPGSSWRDANGWTNGPVELCENAVILQALHRAPPPPSSRLRRLWSRKGNLQRAWNRDRKAVWDQVGFSHCRHKGLVMVRDEARLRWCHSDQSRRGHQCSETTLTGESQFHISTPPGIEPGSLMTGSKRMDHWTSGTVGECSEIALHNSFIEF